MQLRHLFSLWRQSKELPQKPPQQIIVGTANPSLPETEIPSSITDPPSEVSPQTPQATAGESESYFFLRIAKADRWERSEGGNPPTVDEAVEDLKLRPKDKGRLSLYKIFDDQEVKELAYIFSLTLRDNPKHFEYVLFPSNILSACVVEPSPVKEHHIFLSERHHEVVEPSAEQLSHIARCILDSPAKRVGKIKWQQIVDFAIEKRLLDTAEFQGDRVHSKWRKKIEEKKARPNKDN